MRWAQMMSGDRRSARQVRALSANRCRAARRETPSATATWFHLLPVSPGDLDGLPQPCLVVDDCGHRQAASGTGDTMRALFAELANVQTSMGQLILRRRREPSRHVDV
jgi:hypothetical protein